MILAYFVLTLIDLGLSYLILIDLGLVLAGLDLSWLVLVYLGFFVLPFFFKVF